MLNTILVPVDGSDFAERALPYAAMLARSATARVVLLRVLPHRAPGSATDELGAIQASLDLDAGTMRAGGLDVETMVQRIRPIHAEDVARAIIATADEQGAGLIVMSTHGRSGFGRWLYGSVTDSVLRQTSTPILLVPPHAEQRQPTDQPIRLLVPLDGSELAEEAILAAELWAETTDAEMILLRVVEPPPPPLYGDGYAYIPFDPDVEVAEARQSLQVEVDRLQAAGRRVTARTVVGQPSLMVARVAHDEGADVIMMATHGRGGLARLVLGSVATATLQRADMPVLLVRPSAMLQAHKQPSMVPAGVGEPVSAPEPPSAPSVSTIDVPLSVADLELIERGLKTLAYTPGYDYHQAPSVHLLLDRLGGAVQSLEATERTEATEPARTT
jgi:nucleotide-binding universal stress UspA family protein